MERMITRGASCGLVAVLLGGGWLTATAAVSAENAYFKPVVFQGGETEFDGLFRFRGTEALRVTELLLEAPGGGLVAVRFEIRLRPNLASVTRVAINQPEWSIEVADSYPSLQVDSFFEAIDAMSEGVPYVLSIETADEQIGSGELRLQHDQEAGRATALESLVDEERIVESIPEAAWGTLRVLDEIFAPHGNIPGLWEFGRAWLVPSVLGPALRSRLGEREATGWDAIVRPIARQESLNAEERALLGKFQSAGLTDR